MKALSGLEGYLDAMARPQVERPALAFRPAGVRQPVITISRQAGSGAHAVADELVATLTSRAPAGSPPWTVLDRNLVSAVLKDHNLPDRLAEFMPEDRMSDVADMLDALFGLHPSAWSLVRKTAETILSLAHIGNVILIGRGANIVTANLDHAFHVRLVGSVENRVRYMRDRKHLGAQAAADYVRREDLGRKRYVKKYYGRDIDDPLLYHLVINTDRVPYTEAARLIADAVDALHEVDGRTRSNRRPLAHALN